MLERLEEIAAEVERRLKKSKVAGKTVTLKIKYSDFTLQTRSRTLTYFVSTKELLMENVKDLLFQDKMRDSVRLLGISLSNLNNEEKTKEDKPPPEKTIDVQLKFDF